MENKELPEEAYEALGWAWAEACILLDRGIDPREVDCGGLCYKMTEDLTRE